MKGFGGKRPLYVGSHEQGKKKGIGIGVGKGPNGGTIWGRKKKDFVFLAKLKFSKSIDPKKKHIYRIWSWKKIWALIDAAKY